MKMANDVRLYASGPRAGLGELRIPENEPGSSIMPGKVNPTQAEAMTMVAVQVHGNDHAVAFANSQGHFQLNVYKPVILHNVLGSIELLADACHSFDAHCAQGLEPDRARIEAHVQRSLISGLTPHIDCSGRHRPRRTAGLTLRDAALASGHVGGDFDAWVRPTRWPPARVTKGEGTKNHEGGTSLRLCLRSSWLRGFFLHQRAGKRSVARPPLRARSIAAIDIGQVAGDGQAQSRAARRHVRPHAAVQHGPLLCLAQPRAIVRHLDRDQRGPVSTVGATARGCRANLDTAACPLAGVVEQVTDHLVQILPLHGHGQIRGDVRDVHGHTAIRVQPEHRADQRLDRRGHQAARAGRRRGGRGARMRQVVVDLPPHPLHLLADSGGRSATGALDPVSLRASRASGVFSPWARLPALAWARRTASSRCSMSAFRSSTSGWTSAG
jgi:hypothetical protein